MIQIQNCSSSRFMQQIEKRSIICFGGGQNFYDLCEAYGFASQVRYVVDNYKCGTFLQYADRKIPVISMNQMGEEIKDDILIITTLKFADELICQLDRMELCDGAVFYVPEIFTIEHNGSELKRTNRQLIPKIIHYCWFGKGELPREFQKNIESWKKYCSDYEIKCWNEDNYDISQNKYMKQAYEAKKWGFVPDYARLDILYHYGGIYLDTDVEVVKKLDDLLQFEMFCGFERAFRVNLGLGFGAVKGNNTLKKMMELYENMDFRNEDGSLNLLPSFVYQTQTLLEMGMVRNGKTQQLSNVTVLSPEYMAPINEFGFGQPTDNTYSIHHYAATWYDKGQWDDRDHLFENYKMLMQRV